MFSIWPAGGGAAQGLPEPVPAFRVLGEQATRSRFEAHRPQVLPMIGRDHELALIVDRWQQIQASEGQAVFSLERLELASLDSALMAAVSMDELFNVYYQCSPHHTGTALWPVAQQVAYAAGFSVGDPTQ